jgi:hypothetical protein
LDVAVEPVYFKVPPSKTIVSCSTSRCS